MANGPLSKLLIKIFRGGADNFLDDLARFGKRLFRETDVEEALEFTGSRIIDKTRDRFFFGNTPELALGQGGKGVLLEFESKGLQGVVNTSKPGLEFLAEQGKAEVMATLNPQGKYVSALRSITVTPEAIGRKASNLRLQSKLSQLESQGWAKSVLPNGSVKYTSPLAAAVPIAISQNGGNIFLDGFQGQVPQQSGNIFLDEFPSLTTQVAVIAPPATAPDTPPAVVQTPPRVRGIGIHPADVISVAKSISDFLGLPALAKTISEQAEVLGSPPSERGELFERIKRGEPVGVLQRLGEEPPTAGERVEAGVIAAAPVIAKPIIAGARFVLRPIARPIAAVFKRATEAIERRLFSKGAEGLRQGVEQAERVVGARATEAGNTLRMEAVERAAAEEPVLDPRRVKESVQAMIESLRAGEITGDDILKKEGSRLFQQVASVFQMGEINAEQIPRIMAKYGLNAEEATIAFLRMFKSSISEGAKAMQQLSVLRREIGKRLSPEAKKQLDEIFGGIDTGESMWSWLRAQERRVVDIWRATITSQLSTAMRNLGVSTGRMSIMEPFTDVLNGAAQAFAGQPLRLAFRPALEHFGAFWRRMTPAGRKRLTALMEQNPIEENRLFSTVAADLKLQGWLIKTLQIFNRTQEFFVRRWAFDSRLTANLARYSIDDRKLLQGGLGAFDEAQQKLITRAYRDATDFALDISFALRRKPVGEPGPNFWAVTKIYDAVPEAALAHPFLRFWANMTNFMYQNSPLGLTRFVREAERKALAAGGWEQTRAIAKAITGTTLFGAGLAHRLSDEHAGLRFYEFKVGNRVIDLRPWQPFANYSFLGEVAKRAWEGNEAGGLEEAKRRVGEIPTQDFTEAFLGMRRLRESGLIFINELANAQNVGDYVQRIVEGFVPNFIEGFVPFGSLAKDIMSQFDPEEQVVFRQTRGEGLTAGFRSRLPFIGRELEPSFRASRADPIGVGEERIAGLTPSLFRQLTGITTRTESPLEQELARLELRPGARTGTPALDNAINRIVGAEAEQRVAQIAASPRYQKLPDRARKQLLSREFETLRARAKERLFRTPDYRKAAVNDVIEDLADLLPERQRDALARLRRNGSINESMQREIMQRLGLRR